MAENSVTLWRSLLGRAKCLFVNQLHGKHQVCFAFLCLVTYMLKIKVISLFLYLFLYTQALLTREMQEQINPVPFVLDLDLVRSYHISFCY